MNNSHIGWKQSFNQFEKAFEFLKEAIAIPHP